LKTVHPKGPDSTSVQTLTKKPSTKKGQSITQRNPNPTNTHKRRQQDRDSTKMCKNGIDFQSTLLSSQESGANLASTKPASTRRNQTYFSRLIFCCQIRISADSLAPIRCSGEQFVGLEPCCWIVSRQPGQR